MLDFIEIRVESVRKDVVQIFPEFIARRSKDLMIKGHSFYAIWDEEQNTWSTNEYDATRMIDREVMNFASKYETQDKKVIKLLKNFSSKKFSEWQQYCKSMPDNYHWLDEKVIFANNNVTKDDFSSLSLPYPLEAGPLDAWDELIGTLYAEPEKDKLEWAIGSIISGDSKFLQKFLVLYGPPGSGKSTFLEILSDMFKGYCGEIDSKALSNGSAFGLESLRDNPLIGIEDEADLSRIEDNTRLNSVTSHAPMIVNEKFKSTYSARFKTFLFLGTNDPVKIKNAKTGIIRRLIDVSPSGLKVPTKRYKELRKKIKFEYGAIAAYCLDKYKALGPNYYDDYIPIRMIDATNTFYNFIQDEIIFFTTDHPEGVSLDMAWRRYKLYCEDANVPYPYPKMIFKQELKNYFESFDELGGPAKSWYSGFKKNIFKLKEVSREVDTWIHLEEQESLFDSGFEGCKAQYSKKDGTPMRAWDTVRTKLMDIDTSREHYVQLPEQIITVDFDKKDENGNKSLKLNLEAASSFPMTYAETSRSGEGLHLVYRYDGDVSELSPVFDTDIEIKTCIGNSAIRRRLTVCNNVPIAKITNLPKRRRKNEVISDAAIRTEVGLRRMIIKNLKKEIHKDTASSINFIKKILDEAYESGISYDVRDMANDILVFASNSTNQAEKCIKVFHEMKLSSDNLEMEKDTDHSLSNIVARDVFISKLDSPAYRNDAVICFFDVEVFKNLFVICWKKLGSSITNRMINPTPDDVADLFTNPNFKWIGFNNRKYDNHIVFARMLGYSNEQLYTLSTNIIKEGVLKHGFLKAYNISYTDIYDFMNAGNKMSLKKWEIKLKIDHVELDIPWDEEVPEELWNKVADYCCYDVQATEATWLNDKVQADFRAREILSDIAGLTVNDTTNACTTKFIIGNDPYPQEKFIYTDLSKEFPGYEFSSTGIDKSRYNPGTKIVKGKSIYRGEDPGEGGYVFATPGIWYWVPVCDVESMHPTSAHKLLIFGKDYTERYWEIVQMRLAIKHGEYDRAKLMFDGKLAKYLEDEKSAKELAQALKIAINSVYGLTSSTFPNKLRDPRNKDNIVAKRGALFMINLKHEVQDRGFTVAHIKTDSIKIADATSDIVDFVTEYGKRYGYKFAKECVYSKMCLVNESTYVAEVVEEDGEKVTPYWTATGDQFKVPYVFKTLFSREEIEFDDLCETKTVTSHMVLDFGEDNGGKRFIGRVGRFVPVKPGCGGGVLLREQDGKYNAVTGTKKPYKDTENPVYYWKEASIVKDNKLFDEIDYSYWDYLVQNAKDTIAKFGDVDQFINGKISAVDVSPNVDDELPFGKAEKVEPVEDFMPKPIFDEVA